MNAVHARSITAPDRDHNEDAFVVRPTREGGMLLVVCDGMGGMGRGAEAARLATRSLEAALAAGGRHPELMSALQATDETLRTALVDPGPGRPGCTAVSVVVYGNQAWVGWAGDARAVHVRGHDVVGHTVDHRLVEELIASGTLTREEARPGRMSQVVTQCLGGRRSEEPPHQPATLDAAWQLRPGDALVLCSDGLSGVVDDTRIAGLIHGRPAREAVEALLDAARAAGSEDDTTVIVYRHPILADPRPTLRPERSGPGAADETWPASTDTARAGSSNSWLLLAGGVGFLLLSALIAIAWLLGWV